MTKTVRIRVATPGDARALARLRWDFRSARGGTTETEREFVDRCAGWMRDALGRAEWRCYLAEDPGGVLGHLWLQTITKIPNPAAERERHIYLTNVYVRPERRGAGIAGRLIDEALTWCRAQHVDTVFLWPSEKSRPLYARHGFQVSPAILAQKLEP